MNVDIYKIKGTGSYLFVKNGIDVTNLNSGVDLEVHPFEPDRDISAQDNLIGASASDIINEISQNGYSIKEVRIIITENE